MVKQTTHQRQYYSFQPSWGKNADLVINCAIPVGWKAPSLQANSTTVAIEELTLAYEGLTIDGKAGGEVIGNSGQGRGSMGYFGS